jgi:hypothetical protein
MPDYVDYSEEDIAKIGCRFAAIRLLPGAVNGMPSPAEAIERGKILAKQAVLKAYPEAVAHLPAHLEDLLTGIRHLCDETGVDIDAVLFQSLDRFSEQKNERKNKAK